MFARLVHVLGGAAIAVALLSLVTSVYAVRQIYAPLRLSTPSASIEVARGASLAQVANQLHNHGILSEPRALTIYGRLSGLSVRIKAGEYPIHSDDTALTLLHRMVAGKTIRYSITFVEGWSFKQFRAALDEAAQLRHASRGLSDPQIMQALGRTDEHPEGRFFPDTYVYARGDSDLSILHQAATALDTTLAAAWADRDAKLPYKRAYDALIMASIVEKETGAAHERARIAGVFVRRLRKNMKLQTDPTVIYGMGDRFDGDIRRKDLRENTPYNTYVHKGLPPTPIANPGAHAIRAALQPEAGTVLYFVAKGDGTHQFSDTYAQHKRAVKRFQLSRAKGKQ